MPGDSLYDRTCKRLYGWTKDKNYFAELGKTIFTLPASAVCAVGADGWMDGYVKGK